MAECAGLENMTERLIVLANGNIVSAQDVKDVQCNALNIAPNIEV